MADIDPEGKTSVETTGKQVEEDVSLSKSTVDVPAITTEFVGNVVTDLGGQDDDRGSLVKTPSSTGDSASSSRLVGSSAPSGTTHPSLSMPHPKKFSAVNINKKFLEKNASLPGSGQPSMNSVASKPGGSAPKQTPESLLMHSRLVTAKLTAAPRPSSTTGPGWSRPSSSTPPAPPSPANPNPAAPIPTPASTAAPQLPHVGKVIQPQPRLVAPSKEAPPTNKPVWGNVKPVASVPMPDITIQSDFPTAAEVAQVRAVKQTEKVAADAAVAQHQASQADADTFRGIHLNPNAHHWDEMEEDDDNFLDEVIDFGDGRQYKIQPADAAPPASPPHEPSASRDGDELAKPPEPVRKEERFVDDFDRSWPRSRRQWQPSEREAPPHGQPNRSPHEASRVLFNERSNRMEPYAGSHGMQRQPGPGQPPYLSSRRDSRSDHATSPVEPRRELPSQARDVHLLQKPGRGSGSLSPGLSGTFPNHDRWRDHDAPRRDSQMSGFPMARTASYGKDSAWGRDQHQPFAHTDRDRDIGMDRGKWTPHTTQTSQPFSQDRKDAARQMPPHLSQMPPPPLPSSLRAPSRERRLSSIAGDSPSSIDHPLPVVGSSRRGSSSVVSDSDLQSPVAPLVIDEDMRKAAMHISAERAKLRRQHEEEERERERERAHKKAAEIEERMKAVEAEKAKLQESDEKVATDRHAMEIINDATARGSSQVITRPANVRSSAPTATSGPPPPPTSFRESPAVESAPSPDIKRLHIPTTAVPAPSATSPQLDSWRSKAPPPTPIAAAPGPTPALPSKPVHAIPITTPESLPGSAKQVAVLPPTMPSSVPESDHLALKPGEDLEEVDFSDLAKLVAVPENEPLPPSRVKPVASDFFETETSVKTHSGPWRRKDEPVKPQDQDPTPIRPHIAAPTITLNQHQDGSHPKDITESATPASRPIPFHPPDAIESIASPRRHHPDLSAEQFAGSSQIVTLPPHPVTLRSPRTSSYREASMSALDDTILRVKGVLDGMHSHDGQQHDLRRVGDSHNPAKSAAKLEPPPQSKWLPPARRPLSSVAPNLPSPEETFDVTVEELPRSPKRPWNTFPVRLPSRSRPVESISRRQVFLFEKRMTAIRWDILSWNPPVEGMNRRDFSLNDVLFRKPQILRGKSRYRVSLPRAGPSLASLPDHPEPAGPKVNLPTAALLSRTNSSGAFGRGRGADDASSWRRDNALATDYSTSDKEVDPDLETMSRSPPPEPSTSIVPEKPTDIHSLRSKHQPKMPQGSAVAFYRSPPSDMDRTDLTPAVNFTVTSELEDSPKSVVSVASRVLDPIGTPKAPPVSALPPNPGPTTPQKVEYGGRQAASFVNGLKSQPSSPEVAMSVLMQHHVDSQNMDDLVERTPVTPPSQTANSTWTKSPLTFPIKDSPARAPDPEHLKIVWSQASDKANLPSTNSLEGIGDDLTALPFTLPDVKSEDGETPPPSGAGVSSRMSIHDVTRAFQQVPSSTVSPRNHRNGPLSPPSGTVPIPRQQSSFAFAPPPPLPPTGMRPTYAAYPSPMLSSPSPTLVYPTNMTPSPVLSGMPVNGAPHYAQPVWLPMPGPPAQPPNGMLRTMSSPYAGPMMPYPSPGGGPSMYSSHGMPNSSQQSNGTQIRPGMSMMSPAMSHARPTHPNVPMYGSSPVMVHAPPIPLTPGHPYPPPIQPLATQRNPYNPMGGLPGSQHRPPNHSLPTQSNGYPVIAPSPFVRPTW
ncbi:hypothetical protein JAAARDRAFT_37853 [Jaapia argillacea MUCL 33604]|uniref:Uncharacterized protein n=1 Tax=Jaapia argillacea MUCL 33604 TaxID=933084 RepID=A0A067PLN9_9AGAM|nr:hypothetical protein JAAARDRAFT_37853 [Jaapia argillacea MUCL 33604]